jgi:hypothetical protein
MYRGYVGSHRSDESPIPQATRSSRQALRGIRGAGIASQAPFEPIPGSSVAQPASEDRSPEVGSGTARRNA